MPFMVYYQCHVDLIAELITLTVLWLVISHARRLTSLGRVGCRIVTRPFFSGRVRSGHKTTNCTVKIHLLDILWDALSRRNRVVQMLLNEGHYTVKVNVYNCILLNHSCMYVCELCGI